MTGISTHSTRNAHVTGIATLVDACGAFKAAAPRSRRTFSRNYDTRLHGESSAASAYDGLIADALQHVSASARLVADTMPKALAIPAAEIVEATPTRDRTRARRGHDKVPPGSRHLRARVGDGSS